MLDMSSARTQALQDTPGLVRNRTVQITEFAASQVKGSTGIVELQQLQSRLRRILVQVSCTIALASLHFFHEHIV